MLCCSALSGSRKSATTATTLSPLSENEQRLRNNEREREELEECLKEMSLTDEEREEVHSSLTNLMEHGSRLDKENESLRARLKEYEDNPVPRELELLRKEGERVRMLDGQVQALASVMIDADEVVKQLRIQPKFLADSQWNYLQKLTDRVYKGASKTPCHALSPAYACRQPALHAYPLAFQQCTDCHAHCRVSRFRVPAEIPPEEADDAGRWWTVC